MHRARLSTPVLLALLVAGTLRAAQEDSSEGTRGRFSLLEPSLFTGTVLNTRLSNGLFVGRQGDTTYANFNLGFDLPLVSLTPGSQRYDFGVFAFTHVYTQPRNSKFYVDNLYAGFGIFFSGKALEWLSWRLYPVYHLSAHLADGHRGDGFNTLHAVSNECVRAEALFSPVTGLEAGIALCWFYHTVYRDHLSGLVELNVAYTYSLNPVVGFTAQSLNELWVEDGARYGADLAGGVVFGKPRGRSVQLLAAYYNRPHPGYYADDYEEGYGVRMRFSLR